MSAALQLPPDLTSLTQCQDDVANALELISKLMIDLINNDPAVAQAIIQAITKTGSALPLLGVTNGTPAIAPQVGEYVQLTGTLEYPASGATATALLSLGVLEPGDWDCWLWTTVTTAVQGIVLSLSPLPAGFAANPAIVTYSGVMPPNVVPFTMQVAALTAQQSLIVANTQVAGVAGQGGTLTVHFAARRRR